MDLEIKDYLYAIRRRLWVPIAVPLAAALITSGLILLQPEKYQASATVVVPALSAKGYSTSAVTQYVSTYKDVLISEPVVNQVNLETGENKANLVAGLTASTATASSNIIVVTYTGPSRKSVLSVVEAAAIDSLDTLLSPQLGASESETIVAKASLEAANKDIADFTTKTGLIFPDDDYKNKSQELSQLIVQLEQARLAGDQARVRGLQGIIDTRQKELTALAPLVGQYDSLKQTQSAAQAVYNKSQEDLAAINAEIASDHDPKTVSLKVVGHVSRVPEIIKYGGVALGVAMLLALAFIVAMEFFRPAIAEIPYLRKLALPARPSGSPASPAPAEPVTAEPVTAESETAESETAEPEMAEPVPMASANGNGVKPEAEEVGSVIAKGTVGSHAKESD